jgi:hypothetical protein
MEGPSVLRYSSSGTNPAYYNGAYGLFDSNGEKNYNNNVSISCAGDDYLPQIEQVSTGRYHLVPRAMYFHNADGENIYKNIYISIGTIWYNPLLVIVDPYGNSLLNK